MKFYIFVFGLLFNLNYCFSIKVQRNEDANQQTWAIRKSPSFKSNDSVTSSVEVLETPHKLDNDKKLYRLIRLSNGLTALLVSTQEDILDWNKNLTKNNETSDDDLDNLTQLRKKAACSLHVDMGSFSDPRDVQGLAHFVGESKHINFKRKTFTSLLFLVLSNRTYGIHGLEKIPS